jgi:hypothetical protein
MAAIVALKGDEQITFLDGAVSMEMRSRQKPGWLCPRSPPRLQWVHSVSRASQSRGGFGACSRSEKAALRLDILTGP